MLSRIFGLVDSHRNPTDTWRAACFAAVLLLRLLLMLLSSCFHCFATAFAALLLLLQPFLLCCSPLHNRTFRLRLFEIEEVLPLPKSARPPCARPS